MIYTRTLISMLLMALPFTGWAQDDMYFVPKKKAKTQQTTQQQYVPVEIVYDDDEPLNVTGSTRDVDEYNRRGSRYSGEAQLVQQPDGSFKYQIPANDTLYTSTQTAAVTAGSLADQAYSQGYTDGYLDGEDYSLTRRMGRFNYVSVYSSPWYIGVGYDPYWDDWYWTNSYWYGWHRPYWGYSTYWGYRPYWYGGYYGWHRPHRPYHYGGHGGRPGGYHIGGGTRYTERYRNLRSANRNYTTPRGTSSSVRSVRPGQQAPMGSRGSSYINGGAGVNTRGTRSSSSGSSMGSRSVSTPSVSSSSSSSSRSGTGGFGGVVRGGGSSGGGSRGSGGGFGGGSRGGRR